MKIAITQRQTVINGITYDCLEQGWYRLFFEHELIIVPNLVHIDLDVDMLVLSGGNHTEARRKTELWCCEQADRTGIPILGVCHGAFFLNYALGGINAEIHGHRNIEHTVTMEGEEHTVNSYHEQCIYELGKNLKPVAWTDSHTEAFKHVNKPIWGLVWHPERMDDPVLPSDLRKLING